MPRAPYAMITGQAVPGNAGVALMARLRNASGLLVTQASLASIAYAVTDLTQPPTIIASGVFAVVSSIFDSLQVNDPSWTKDSAANLGQDGACGYNAKMLLPSTAIPVANSGHRIQVDTTFTPISGQPSRVIFSFQTLTVYG